MTSAASASVAALQEARRARSRADVYTGDDLGGSAKLPPSTSAWAVQWKPKSDPPRASTGSGEASPGPVHYPEDRWFGTGPNGKGSEYSLSGRSFAAPLSSKKTKTDKMPGPKYTLTDGFGKQVDSRYKSFNAGEFTKSERKTMAGMVPDSPGPAHYNPPPPIMPPAPKPNGFGSGLRASDYASKPDWRPGPGTYKLPSAIGGNHPNKPSAPVPSFGKGERKTMAGMVPSSPGPIYMTQASVGPQVLSSRKGAPKAPFSKAERFPPGYK